MLTIQERTANALQKFAALINPPKPEPAVESPAEVRKTRDDLLAEEIGPWLAKAPAAFWRELDRWAEAAHTTVRSQISDHSITSYALGFEDGIDPVKAKFNHWRGQPTQVGPQGE